MSNGLLGVLLTVLLGLAVGMIVGITIVQRKKQQRDQQRDQAWHQHYDERIETIERYWRQRLEQEREQTEAQIAQLAALQTERMEHVTFHQRQLSDLEQQHQAVLEQQADAHRQEMAKLIAQNKQAKQTSLNTSRAVIKGKISEQLAPLLPGFQYQPSDARFLGDPIDYVVFHGYSDFKDGHAPEDDLEVVLLEIKTGSAKLSPRQQALSRAIAAGRVRFETVHIQTPTLKQQPVKLPARKVLAPQMANGLDPRQTNHAVPPSKPEPHHTDVRAYQPWFEEEEEVLKRRYAQGFTVRAIAAELQREPSAIRSRLRKFDQRTNAQ